MFSRKNLILLILMFVILISAISGCARKEEKQTLNLLCWTRYAEEDFLKPFEDRYNVEVRTKTYVGGDEMFALFTAAKRGAYDVIVIDVEYGSKLLQAGRLSVLNPSDFDFNFYLEPFKRFPPSWLEGNMYSVIVAWGSIGIVYNKNEFSEEETQSYNILWSEDAKGKAVIWDWYLPNMGVIGRYLGFNEPYNINSDQFNLLSEKLLSLKSQIKAIHANSSDIIADFSSGDAILCPGIGEWVAAILIQNGEPIDWKVPNEGGVMWVEGLAIPVDSKNPELAINFIKYVQEPQVQASLAWRNAYCSNVPNIKAYDYMNEEQKNILRIHNKEEALDLLNKLAIRTLPTNQTEEQWQRVWEEFKTR